MNKTVIENMIKAGNKFSCTQYVSGIHAAKVAQIVETIWILHVFSGLIKVQHSVFHSNLHFKKVGCYLGYLWNTNR